MARIRQRSPLRKKSEAPKTAPPPPAIPRPPGAPPPPAETPYDPPHRAVDPYPKWYETCTRSGLVGWYPKIISNIRVPLSSIYSHTEEGTSVVRKGVIRGRDITQNFMDEWDKPADLNEIDAAGCLSFFLRMSLGAMLSSTSFVPPDRPGARPQFFQSWEDQYKEFSKQPKRVPISHARNFLQGPYENLDGSNPQGGEILDVDDPLATHEVGVREKQPSIRPVERYIGSWSVIGDWKGGDPDRGLVRENGLAYYYLEVMLGANDGRVVLSPLTKLVQRAESSPEHAVLRTGSDEKKFGARSWVPVHDHEWDEWDLPSPSGNLDVVAAAKTPPIWLEIAGGLKMKGTLNEAGTEITWENIHSVVAGLRSASDRYTKDGKMTYGFFRDVSIPVDDPQEPVITDQWIRANGTPTPLKWIRTQEVLTWSDGSRLILDGETGGRPPEDFSWKLGDPTDTGERFPQFEELQNSWFRTGMPAIMNEDIMREVAAAEKISSEKFYGHKFDYQRRSRPLWEEGSVGGTVFGKRLKNAVVENLRGGEISAARLLYSGALAVKLSTQTVSV